MDLKKLNGVHSGLNMANQVENVLTSHGCEKKLIALICDNASSNISLGSQLTDLLPNLDMKKVVSLT